MPEYIYADLTAREPVTADGTPFNFEWIAGQRVTYALRFFEDDSSGARQSVEPEILNLRAAVGYLDSAPLGGFYRIKIGYGASNPSNTTEKLSYNAEPEAVEAALNALGDVEYHCDESDAGLLIRRSDGSEIDRIQLIPEGLRPTSFGKVTGGQKFKEKKARALIGGLGFTSKLLGELGNEVSVEILLPFVPAPAPVIVVDDKKIRITLAATTTALGAITSNTKGFQLKQAIEAHVEARELVSVALADSTDRQGENFVTPRPLVFLSGGMNPYGGFEYSLQIVQAPVVYSSWLDRILPPKPVITKIQSGGTSPDGMMKWNTIMSLQVPPDFRGSYQFNRPQKFKRSSLLSKDDTISTIKSILDNFLSDEGGIVKATNPNTNIAHIEFEGEFEGQDVELLEIVVYSSPPPDFAFDLDFSSADLHEALGERESIDVQFELEATFYADERDKTLGTKTLKLWRTKATVRKQLLWDSLAISPPVDWQRRAVPMSYVPFSTSQVLVGHQGGYTTVIGDGAATSFDINHGLSGEGEGVVAVEVRENIPEGRRLRDDEYTLRYPAGDSVELHFTEPPAQNSLAVIVVGYGAESIFTQHTHPIDQIKTIGESGEAGESLRDILLDFAERIQRLEALLPRGGVNLPSGLQPAEVKIPPIGEILPDLAVEEAGDGFTLASQVLLDDSKKAEVIPGTDLETKQRELEIENKRLQAELDANKLAAEEAIRIAAKEAAEQATAAALAAAKTSLITKISLNGIGAMEGEGTNRKIAYKTLPAKRGAKYGTLLSAAHGTPVTASALPTQSGLYIANQSLVLPGGGGRKSQAVVAGDVFRNAGGLYYKMIARDGAYYPEEMEFDIFRVLIYADQFPQESELVLGWQVQTSFASESILGGCAYIQEVSVASVGDDGSEISLDTGSLSPAVVFGLSRIVFSKGSSEIRNFQLKLLRTAGAGTGRYTDFGVTNSTPAVPAGPFVLSIRMTRFDLDNTTTSPTGQVGVYVAATQAVITSIS
jgi:hypothetical protein